MSNDDVQILAEQNADRREGKNIFNPLYKDGLIEGYVDGYYSRYEEIKRLKETLDWLRAGIEHFTHDEDQTQVQHLIAGIDRVIK